MLTDATRAVTFALSMGEGDEISQRSLQLAWLGGAVIGMAAQGARHNKMVDAADANGTEVRKFKALLF